jgi:hypothetical protein
MNPSSTRDGGLEVHQASSAVAYGGAEHPAEVIDLGAIGTRPCASDPRLRHMPSPSQPLLLG